MNLFELAALGAEVRKAQIAYFKTRGQTELVRSKTLEKTFDAAVAKVLQAAAAQTPFLPPEREGFHRYWFAEGDQACPSTGTLLGFRFVTDDKGYAVVREQTLPGRAFLMEIEEEKWVQLNRPMRW